MENDTKSTFKDQYGPSLPPTSQVQLSRESWMVGESCQSKLFESLAKPNKSKKVGENEVKKEYDYSSPGLHVMGSSPKRLFSSKIKSESNEQTELKIKEMKKRFKDNKKNYDSSSHASGSKRSEFMLPQNNKFSPHSSSQNRLSRPKSRSLSPKSPQKRSNSRDECSRHNRKSRSRSPKERRKSKSPVKKSKHIKSDVKSHHKDDINSPSKPQISKNTRQESSHQKSYNNSPSKAQISKNSSEESNNAVIKEDDLNKLSAKILKAEIIGDTKRVVKLNKKLEVLRSNLRKQLLKPAITEETIILTDFDLRGNVRPIEIDTNIHEKSKKRKKEKHVTTHDSLGSRDKYFPDDKKKNMSSLLEEEKSLRKLGHDEVFMNNIGKLSKMANNRQNWTIDDMFESNISKEKEQSQNDVKSAIAKNKLDHKRLESCQLCLEKCSKGSIIHIGEHLYIRVPPHKSLTTYHCQIVPISHVIASVNADEEFWEELTTIKRTFVNEMITKNLDVVFLESAQRLNYRRHIFIDCIPVPKDEGTILPAYFKKAIMDCDLEWAQNKKLVDTRKKCLSKSIPKGLPYFSVEFGIDGGFAHVIEEESLFKSYFGLEIVGGVLDCDMKFWRNPEKETTECIQFKKRNFEKLSIFSDVI